MFLCVFFSVESVVPNCLFPLVNVFVFSIAFLVSSCVRCPGIQLEIHMYLYFCFHLYLYFPSHFQSLVVRGAEVSVRDGGR